MKILIIGAKGMLGQYLAQVFSGNDLVLSDKDDLDITQADQLEEKIKKIQPQIIINCAAYNNVDGAESNQQTADLINGQAVGYLAQVAEKIGAILVHYSTGYVFSGQNQDGYTETNQPEPINVYGKSKLLGEQELQNKVSKYYLIRTSRLFGKQGSGEGMKKPFVDLIIETAQKYNNKIKGVNEEYDLPTYALDLAQKTKEIIDEKLEYGIYHISNSGEPCTWYGFAKEIFKIKNMEVEIEPVSGDAFGKRPAMRPMYASMKNTKLSPLRTWQEALIDYLMGS